MNHLSIRVRVRVRVKVKVKVRVRGTKRLGMIQDYSNYSHDQVLSN